MAIEIPIPEGNPAFAETVELDGEFFRFVFRFNVRAGGWFFDLRTTGDDPILSSIAVTVGIPLFDQYRSRADVPAGDLFAVDTTEEGNNPGETELGDRVRLVYLTAEEFAGI